jgi:Methyltransferase domain
MTVLSPLTGKVAQFLFRHKVLEKYLAEYFYDEDTGYIFVHDPHWLDQAYSEAISSMDTGILARNLSNIASMRMCLHQHPFTKGVDLGAGYGLFVRGMRDHGFDFYWHDKYCENLLARGFEAERGEYSTAVAFEVLEHIQNPLSFLRDTEFKFQTCFFSATCFQKIPDENWWYWGFETGQHISFFSEKSLSWIAAQLGMRLWYIERDIFAFSQLEWTPTSHSAVNRLRRLFLKRQSQKSLVWDDYRHARQIVTRNF